VKSRLGVVLACLDYLEDIVWEPYKHEGAGKLPRNSLGNLKALIVKRIRSILSGGKLYGRKHYGITAVELPNHEELQYCRELEKEPPH